MHGYDYGTAVEVFGTTVASYIHFKGIALLNVQLMRQLIVARMKNMEIVDALLKRKKKDWKDLSQMWRMLKQEKELLKIKIKKVKNMEGQVVNILMPLKSLLIFVLGTILIFANLLAWWCKWHIFTELKNGRISIFDCDTYVININEWWNYVQNKKWN